MFALLLLVASGSVRRGWEHETKDWSVTRNNQNQERPEGQETEGEVKEGCSLMSRLILTQWVCKFHTLTSRVDSDSVNG